MEEFLFLDIKALAITTVVRRIIFLKKCFNFPSGTQIFTLLRFGGRSEFLSAWFSATHVPWRWSTVTELGDAKSLEVCWPLHTGAKNQRKSATLERNISVTHPCTLLSPVFSPSAVVGIKTLTFLG